MTAASSRRLRKTGPCASFSCEMLARFQSVRAPKHGRTFARSRMYFAYDRTSQAACSVTDHRVEALWVGRPVYAGPARGVGPAAKVVKMTA